MSPRTAARAFYRDLSTLDAQAARQVLRLWRRVDRGNISASWLARLPQAAAILVAAQTVAAELVDPYLTEVLDDGPDRQVNVDGFHATTPDGWPVESLLYLPAIDAKDRISAGAAPGAALRLAQNALTTYVRTTVADTGRLATAAGMAARPHATGWYRMLQPPSCARCAILAGKRFRWNQGFRRHPRCDCVHIPVQEADDSLAFDARKAIEAGQVTGLSKGELEAIKLGADPAQVVNARRKGATYLASGRRFTTEGTTRRGIAGARMLRRDVDRALGADVRGRTYTDLTFDRLEAARYADLFRQGKRYTRLTSTGRVQTYSYRYARTPRPTAEQLIADATSREDAVRLLTNFGYIL